MFETFTISGGWQTTTQAGGTGDITAQAPLAYALAIQNKAVLEYQLSSNTPVAVTLPAGGVNVVYVYATGGPVSVTVTSTAGTAQVSPADPMFFATSQSVPITALTITRLSSAITDVSVFYAQQS